MLAENEPFTNVPEPSTVDPFFRVTVPVGEFAWETLGATVVLNVTDCPYTDGLPEDAVPIWVP